MTAVPDKCLDCDHTIIQLEDVNQGWGKYQLEPVIRCDCFPAQYIVGCTSAEVYCEKKSAQTERRINERRKTL